MEPHIILDAEFTRLHKGKCKGITNGQHTGGRNTRGNTKWAGFIHHAHTQHYIAMLAKSRVDVAGYYNQFNSLLLNQIYQPNNFIGFTTITEYYYNIIFPQPAQISVDGFSRVKEVAWRSCRSQSSAYLLSYYTSLADAAYYAGATAVINHPAGLGKRFINNRGDRAYGIRFSPDYVSRIFKVKLHFPAPYQSNIYLGYPVRIRSYDLDNFTTLPR
jgi:hypothetical protein